MTYEEIVQAARTQYVQDSDGNIEIDEQPATSDGATGSWVQAWVWVERKGDAP